METIKYIKAYIQKFSNFIIYKRMRWSGMSNAEIADAVIFPSALTPKEEREALEALKNFRKMKKTTDGL